MLWIVGPPEAEVVPVVPVVIVGPPEAVVVPVVVAALGSGVEGTTGAAPGATNCPLVSIEIKRPSTERVNNLNLLVSLVIMYILINY